MNKITYFIQIINLSIMQKDRRDTLLGDSHCAPPCMMLYINLNNLQHSNDFIDEIKQPVFYWRNASIWWRLERLSPEEDAKTLRLNNSTAGLRLTSTEKISPKMSKFSQPSFWVEKIPQDFFDCGL